MATLHTHTDRILRTAEAAEFLGLAKRTLVMWRYQGEGPRYVRLGHARRATGYRLGDLVQFIGAGAENTVEVGK